MENPDNIKDQTNDNKNKILVGKYGDNTVELGNITDIDSMLNFADEMFKEIKNNKITVQEADKKYRDFKSTYPVIYRLILENKEYNRKSFRLYLEYISEKNKKTGSYWKDEHDFAVSQSLYMINLFKNKKPKPTAKQILTYKNSIKKTIEEEWKKTKSAINELENISSENIYTKQLINEIKKMIKLPENEILRLQQPNWNAALGNCPAECI
jgi:hypothetical protein